MTKVKTIKINKPMPDNIKRAIERKNERMAKIKSGEIDVSNLKPIKRVV